VNSSYEIARAVRAPILLIVIGTLFVLSQFDVAEFQRTWPVLIIAFGLLKLIERAFAPPAPPYPGPAYPGPHYPAPYQRPDVPPQQGGNAK
jgi:hypothetical protein